MKVNKTEEIKNRKSGKPVYSICMSCNYEHVEKHPF